MQPKRVAKQQRRNKRKAAKHQQRQRREAKIRAPLEARGGALRMGDIDTWICNERNWKPGSRNEADFFKILMHITELNLLLLDDHKHQMAALMIMMERKHEVTQWRKTYGKLYESADHIFKLDADDMQSERELDQRMMSWLVTGDLQWLDDVYVICFDHGHPWQEHAAELMGYYADRFAEVREYVEHRRGIARTTDPDEDQGAVSLRDILANSENWRRIVYVRQEKDVYVIGTDGECQIEEAPLTHNDRPVIHRVATGEELARYRRQLEEMEDPV